MIRINGIQFGVYTDWTHAWNAALTEAMRHGYDLKVPHSVVTQLMKCTLTRKEN